MTDPVKAEQAPPSEAGFSTNLYLYHPSCGKQQFTLRGARAEDWPQVLEAEKAFLTHMRELGWMFENEWLTQPKAEPTEPEYIPVDDHGSEVREPKSFTAESLVVSMANGKYYHKVMGGPFKKFGVSVWPEVLEACGLDVSDPTKLPNIAGYFAAYIEKEKDGKFVPDKIVRLMPPKKAQ